MVVGGFSGVARSSGEDPVSRFKIIYANLPIEERKLAVVVIDDQPISWEMASREINFNTELGKKIIEKLVSLKII